MADPGDAFVFVDNHDNQRGHGGAGNVVTFKASTSLYTYIHHCVHHVLTIGLGGIIVDNNM